MSTRLSLIRSLVLRRRARVRGEIIRAIWRARRQASV